MNWRILFGITPEGPYVSSDEYATEKSRGYLLNGIYALWGGTEEEYIMPDQIREISTVIEKKQLSVAEIMMSEAHLRYPRDVAVRPARKRPTLQQTVDALDAMLNGQATLNDLFSKVGRQNGKKKWQTYYSN